MSSSPASLDGQESASVPQRRSDVMIAVMGPTGTGKSSFIQLITGDKGIKVGYGMGSETSEIQFAHYFEPDGRCVTFVEFPGFDDSREGVTDVDILDQIAFFLMTCYKNGKSTLNGIIYLHRIIDPRMGGISTRNLRIFKRIFGSDVLENVIVVTTRWDTIEEKDGEARENELMTNPIFFQSLIAGGGRFFRHDKSSASALQVMEQFFKCDRATLRIQVELAEGKMLVETEAGSELGAQMSSIIQRHGAELEEIRMDMARAISEKDVSWKQELEREREKREEQLTKWESEKQRLERGPSSFRERAAVAKVIIAEKLEEKRQATLSAISKQKEIVEEKELQEIRLGSELNIPSQQTDKVPKEVLNTEAKNSRSDHMHEKGSSWLQKVGIALPQLSRRGRTVADNDCVSQGSKPERSQEEKKAGKDSEKERLKEAEERARLAEERVRATEERARAAEERARVAEDKLASKKRNRWFS